MAKLNKILTLTILLISQSYAGTICSSENLDRLNSSIDTFSSLEDLFKHTAPKARLHVFGEAHFYTNTQLLASIIETSNRYLSGTNKCLFLEIPKGGLKKFDETFRQYLERQDLNETDRKKLETFSKYYPAIVQSAQNQGMQIFEIDHPDHLSGDMTEDDRNEAMASSAFQLLDGSTCESAIFFVGKAHISPLENRISVVELMNRKGLGSITYNVSDYSEQSEAILASWGGLSCIPRDILPVAFSNSVLTTDTPLYPKFMSQRKPLWNDFDYSISR